MGETERGKIQSVFHLWIEKERQILSFHISDGFERRDFCNWNDMIDCALKLAADGYRVQ